MSQRFTICGNDPKALINAPLRGEREVVIDLWESVDGRSGTPRSF